MDGIGGVLGMLGGGSMSSQDQSAINQAVGVVAQSTFQMMFNQLMQTTNAFQETMQDDEDYPNQYDGF